MRSLEVLPTRAVYRSGQPVVVEVRGPAGRGTVRVLRLGDPVAEQEVDGAGPIDLGVLPPAGYGVELDTTAGRARTALEVLDTAPRRLRYGFVSDYRPARDIAGVVDNVRRLHLTHVQFYDWAYRHANLLGGGELYDDALSQPIALDTVRRLVAALHEVGARALGYAAVYGVGDEEWPTWRHAALLTPSGTPYSLGGFLRLVDPADPSWLRHFTGELRGAADDVGFDGFHLDQYGYPKHAARTDGTPVALEDSFAAVIAAVRQELPSGTLVFNNVNDFPTWRTGPAPQDAVYVEVWPPHTTLGHLANLADRAREASHGKPVVVAAYQHVYDGASAAEADLATAFTMATLFSHGATHLLCGEADRILVDPYYVRNHRIESSTADLLARWYDFDAEHCELLYDDALHDMTGALAGEYNADCDITYGRAGNDGGDHDGAGHRAVKVTETPTPRSIWRRIVGAGDRLVVHLINLADQDDTDWDLPRKPVGEVAGGVLRVRRAAAATPRVRVADPDAQPSLTDLDVRLDGDYVTAELPPLRVWQLIVIDLNGRNP